MKKTLKLWMLLVVALYIVSCTDINDSPVVYGPLNEALANTGIFTEIKENPDAAAMKKKDELNYLSQYRTTTSLTVTSSNRRCASCFEVMTAPLSW